MQALTYGSADLTGEHASSGQGPRHRSSPSSVPSRNPASNAIRRANAETLPGLCKRASGGVLANEERGCGQKAAVPAAEGTIDRCLPMRTICDTGAKKGVGSHPGGGLTPHSGCPAGSAFQNMILSKWIVWVSARQSR